MKLFQSTYKPSFDIGGYHFHVSNIVLERLQRSIPKHSHSRNSYEIHYIVSGYGHARINDINYEIVPNTLYVTGPFIEHEQIPFEIDPMNEYCIYFKLEQNKRKKDKSLAVNAYDKNDDEVALVQNFTLTDFWFGQDTQNIHELLTALIYELEHQYTGYEVQIQALLKQLIVKLVRNYESNRKTFIKPTPTDSAAGQYFIIEECFLYEYKTLTLDYLASRLNLSRRQTERLLKLHYDKTFLQKRNESRMSAATILLKEPTRTISEIADTLGYSTIEHFSAAFKRYFGISATQYRNKL